MKETELLDKRKKSLLINMTKQDKKTKSKQSILASSKQESAADVKEVKES